MTIQQNDDYELEYWLKNLDMSIRFIRMKELINESNLEIDKEWSICDVGSGPYGGVFNITHGVKMYAVDPLWDKYDQNHLKNLPNGVIPIKGTAEDFTIENKVDLIFSMNALDHAGDFKKSVYNIMDNIVEDGLFYLHVHLRNASQLNAGHKMVLTEEMVLDAVSEWSLEYNEVYDECPLDKKGYKTFIGIIRKTKNATTI